MFIRAYLTSIGVTPVDLSAFYTLKPPPVSGVAQVGRQTNLTGLTVDTRCYTRYRMAANPDFGDQLPQRVVIHNRPTIPTADGLDSGTLTAIADTAAFHFAAIEQGGISLYARILPKSK